MSHDTDRSVTQAHSLQVHRKRLLGELTRVNRQIARTNERMNHIHERLAELSKAISKTKRRVAA